MSLNREDPEVEQVLAKERKGSGEFDQKDVYHFSDSQRKLLKKMQSKGKPVYGDPSKAL